MTQRYERRLAGDKWAIVDNKKGKPIGHIHNRVVAEQVVIELNKMEAAHGA